MKLFYCAELDYKGTKMLTTGYSEIASIAELVDLVKKRYPEHQFLRIKYTLWED